MKKYMLGLFVLSFVLIPWFSFAQVSDIYYPNPSMSDCVSIVNNLRYRDRDIYKNGEVSTLQDFLQGKGYLNNEPTGYFGLLTTKAVKDFQRANNINSDGSVGPITRAKIQALTCGGTNYNDPVISGTQGPQNLSINETGTWRILATDSSGGSLSYSVNWGDNMVYGNGTTSMYPQPLPIQQSATFTHSYSQRGTYTPTFTVTSDNGIRCIMAPCPSGGSASTSLSVNVGGTIPSSSITVLSPNGGETLYRGNNFQINWQDNTPYGCPVGANCIAMPVQRYYDISLVSYNPPCGAGQPCLSMAMPYRAPIAERVYGPSYNWQVGNVLNNVVNGSYVSSGLYTIQVCQTGTGMCDSSNSPFTLSSATTNTPSITVLSPNGGETHTMGQIFYPQWKVSGMSVSDYVTIELQDIFNNNQIVLGRGQAIDGSVKLAFPIDSSWALGTRYKIRITAENSSGNTIAQDYSDNPFTIQ